MHIYSRMIETDDAWREGREPSHDGEYVTLYWSNDAPEGQRWIIANNAGVEYVTDGLPEYREAIAEAESWAEEDKAVLAAAEKAVREEPESSSEWYAKAVTAEGRQNYARWCREAIEIIEQCLKAEDPSEYGTLIPECELEDPHDQALHYMVTGEMY